jgi:hypothetical protein
MGELTHLVGRIQDLRFKKRRSATMPINHNEIIEEIEGQIRKCHGAWEEWSVGTAKDSRGPFFQRHREAELGDGLAYREAYTTTAAEAVVEHLVTHRGLTIDRDSAAEPGKIVFVYRRTSPMSEVRGPKSEKQWQSVSG